MILAEFDARTARAMRRVFRTALPFAVASVACLVLALLFEIRVLYGPGELRRVATGGFLGSLVLTFLTAAWAGHRAERAEGLMCPVCGRSLVGGAYAYRTTFVRAKGRCPTCRTQVLTDPFQPGSPG